MQQTKVDYIIVGLGLAGTWLSHELIKRGHDIIVFNHTTDATSSKKAAGLYNPITGRKMLKTWRADDFFPTLESKYSALENFLSSHFLHPKPIYRPFKAVSDLNDWQANQSDHQYDLYLKTVLTEPIGIEALNDGYGGIVLDQSGYVDLPTMLDAYQSHLISKGIYHEEVFDYQKVDMQRDIVSYKNWSAKGICFCEGPSTSNPFWKELPFQLVRGEVLDIECDMKSEYIINQGVFMIPKSSYFTVGSTYDRKVLSFEPQAKGIQELKERIAKLYRGSFQIIDQRAGIRPATYDRKPFIGFHKKFRTIAIFNGFGTKGVSLTPYFAKHFVDVLENKCELDQEVNVQRVS